jgi:cysteine desulfurase
MGLEADAMRRVLRVSSGWATTAADWLALAAAIVESHAALRSEADGSTSTVISI